MNATKKVRARDWAKWSGTALWSLREASYLLNGDSPPASDAGFLREVAEDERLAWTYRGLKNGAASAAFSSIDATGKLMGLRASPGDVVAWARREGMSLPPELESAFPAAVVPASEQRSGTPAKLTPEQRDDVVRRFRGGKGDSVASLSRRFEVSRPTIDKALQQAGAKVGGVKKTT